MGCLEGYKIPFIQTPVQKLPAKNRNLSYNDEKIIELEIKKLLEKGAIEECIPCENQFVSRFFLVPKPDGSFRFIFNLKKLNEYINPPHFKLEDIKVALNLISRGDFMGSLDLKDAYFVVPIFEEHKKFSRFNFRKKFFQFCCSPFGLSISPYIFTKIVKPITNFLRTKGIFTVVHLDDFLSISKSKDSCERSIKTTVKLLEKVGFVINFEKNNLVADQRCKFLGFIIDSVKFTLNLTGKKKNQIVDLCNYFKVDNNYKLRDFARFIGVLAAACLAVAYGLIHTTKLEREKFLALKMNGGDYEGKIIIREKLRNDIDWWK